ncbi:MULTISPECIES: WXG100 family type VII secretion target [Streptomyces]|uniref:WXG100 family type VII secretion target n=1 Tax=Streptomyces lycii TaxID=2654337 RepID=A0ABQ7FCV1_9ACTN|nr:MULTISPECIES: WXG100 family type VII secretion target [Streptomyces]KAF4405098.1 WXG100 family type VII secretion target [Streptomyces lycii]PGH48879.1 WXG100 family type VII secretion target [Streptomyces sp. Ru87]
MGGKNDVNLTYQDMEDAAGKLKEHKEDIQRQLGQAQKFIKSLVNDGFVTEKASKKFDESYEEFSKGATEMMEGMDGMGQFLKSAASAFRNLDTELEGGLKK